MEGIERIRVLGSEITHKATKKEVKPSDFEKKVDNDPFADFGNSVSIDDDFLD